MAFLFHVAPDSLHCHSDLHFAQRLDQKGSDASNIYDEEVAPWEVEYSDDEEERKAKERKKREKYVVP